MNSLATMAVVGGLLAFSSLRETSSHKTRLVLVLSTLAAGVIATFSFASGMAVWPALLTLAFLRRTAGKILAALGLTGAACLAIFLCMPNNSKSEVGGSLGGLLNHPLMLVLHFAQVLGAPWGFASEWLFPPGTEPSTLLIAAVTGGLGLHPFHDRLFPVVALPACRREGGDRGLWRDPVHSRLGGPDHARTTWGDDGARERSIRSTRLFLDDVFLGGTARDDPLPVAMAAGAFCFFCLARPRFVSLYRAFEQEHGISLRQNPGRD